MVEQNWMKLSLSNVQCVLHHFRPSSPSPKKELNIDEVLWKGVTIMLGVWLWMAKCVFIREFLEGVLNFDSWSVVIIVIKLMQIDIISIIIFVNVVILPFK